MRPIRVALRRIDPPISAAARPRADAALTRALQALNAGRGGLSARPGRPRRDRRDRGVLPRSAAGRRIAGTGIEGVDGGLLDGASTRVLFNPDTGFIERAAIVFSTSLETRAYEAAMLTELTQAMGLITEIDAPPPTAAPRCSPMTATPPGARAAGHRRARRHYERR